MHNFKTMMRKVNFSYNMVSALGTNTIIDNISAK